MEVTGDDTVSGLMQKVKQALPQLAPHTPLVAVNRAFAEPDLRLKEGDEVAFLPPFSGGQFVELTGKPIDPQAMAERVRRDSCGAVVVFWGVVRNENEGKAVLSLEYEAYTPMAEEKLRQVAQEVRQRWQVEDVAICHRVGPMEVGEIAVVIAVAAPHRHEAFQACHFAIDRIKEIVPLWKKEVYQDGTRWVG